MSAEQAPSISLRAALGYVEQSADPAKTCNTCQQYTVGRCRVLRGPVASAASCRAFVARLLPVVPPTSSTSAREQADRDHATVLSVRAADASVDRYYGAEPEPAFAIVSRRRKYLGLPPPVAPPAPKPRPAPPPVPVFRSAEDARAYVARSLAAQIMSTRVLT